MTKAQRKLASELLRLRNAARLSQKDIAMKLGYGTSQFISNWERGLSAPPVRQLKLLAGYYKLNPSDLKALIVARAVEEATAKIEKEFADS